MHAVFWIRICAPRTPRASDHERKTSADVSFSQPVAKKLREISDGREGVLEKARYETWHAELKGMEERCWELVRAFRNPPES